MTGAALVPTMTGRDKCVAELVKGLQEYDRIPNFEYREEGFKAAFHQGLFDKYYSCLQAGVTMAELRAVGERYNFDFRSK